MGGLEFYIYDNELWYRTATGETNVLDESCSEVIKDTLERIREDYPLAYKALMKIYQRSSFNVQYYQYLIVRRFCKCNFGKLDSTYSDVMHTACNFEKVECPLRGECEHEGVICMPKFNSSLSAAELRVMRLVYDGEEKDTISRELCISPETVKNHIKSVYRKLNIHDKASFIRYANENHLFTN